MQFNSYITAILICYFVLSFDCNNLLCIVLLQLNQVVITSQVITIVALLHLISA